MDEASSGKIARLPWELREQVNRRLRDGEPARKICAWLNSLPVVLQILDEHFHEQPVSEQNVSNWRSSGYAKWLGRQQTIDQTRELASYSVEIAKASGGNIADGTAQILAGEIMRVLEELKALQATNIDTALDAAQKHQRLIDVSEAIDSLVHAVSKIRKGDQGAETLRLLRDKLAQAERALELEQKKFQRSTCELFLKWRNDRRAVEIADGPGPDSDKVDQLGQHIFGDLWK